MNTNSLEIKIIKLLNKYKEGIFVGHFEQEKYSINGNQSLKEICLSLNWEDIATKAFYA